MSSPNTPGLRELQDKKPLTALLTAVVEANKKKDNPRPVFLKIAQIWKMVSLMTS